MGLSYSPSAMALCSSWGASLTVAPKGGVESKALLLTWNTAPASCMSILGDDPVWGGVDHYEIHRSGAISNPFGSSSYYAAANFVASVSGVAYSDFVHRSFAKYHYRVYACEDSSCNSFYGDGSGGGESVNNGTADGQTEKEKYIITGIAGPDEPANGVVVNNDAIAPHAVYYPSSWNGVVDGKFGLYYGIAGDETDASQVWYMLHDDVGWPTGGFNASAYWDSPVLVAEGSTDPADDDFAVDHPWTILTRNPDGNRVELMLQTQYGRADTPSHDEHIVQVHSSDAYGTDFGLGTCSTHCDEHVLNSTNAAFVAVDADGTSGTSWVASAAHSRVVYDYVADPYVDEGVDFPFMFFQMDRPDTGSCTDPDSDPMLFDDIGIATTSSWEDGVWDWDVSTFAGAPYCPQVTIPNGHDVTFVPIPGNAYRVYFKSYEDNLFYVSYWESGVWDEWWDGTGMVTASPVQFVWDDTVFTDGPSPQCMGDLAAIVNLVSGTAHDGMFFQILDDAVCDSTPDVVETPDVVGFDDDSPHNGDGVDDGAIVFAELSN